MGVRQARDTRGRKSELQEMLVGMGPGSGGEPVPPFPLRGYFRKIRGSGSANLSTLGTF